MFYKCIIPGCIVMIFALQFFHPFETKHYHEVVSTLRMIGRECISKRIKALDNGDEVPLDILSHILKVASKLCEGLSG